MEPVKCPGYNGTFTPCTLGCTQPGSRWDTACRAPTAQSGTTPPITCSAVVRTFETGANRDVDTGKLDYEGFLSPAVLTRFAEYMHKNRAMRDGTLRDADNWQKGIPVQVYMKSMWRHFMAVWQGYRGGEQDAEELCALLFNVQGMLHEVLKVAK